MAKDDHRLRHIYGQIIAGVSATNLNSRQIFIRHTTPLEQAELDADYDFFYTKAVERSLPTEAEKLAQLLKDGVWTDAEQSKLENDLFYLENLKLSKKNLALMSQIEAQNQQIAEAEKGIAKQEEEKLQLIGLTAEGYAKKKMNERYIFKSIFTDRHCSHSFYTDDEFEYLDTTAVNELAEVFNSTMREMTEGAIKKIASAPFFQNTFNLCDDDVMKFYGKPVVALTFLQSDLFGYGRFFKHVLSAEPKPSAEILADPDKIIDWFNAGKNAEKMFKDRNEGAVGVFGATQDDMKALSEKHGEVISFEQAAQGKGGLQGEELMKLLV